MGTVLGRNIATAISSRTPPRADRAMTRCRATRTHAGARRLVVAVVGFTVLLLGLALIVLPGPAVAVIPIGLAILATEFVWARRLLRRMRTGAERLTPSPRIQTS